MEIILRDYKSFTSRKIREAVECIPQEKGYWIGWSLLNKRHKTGALR